MYQSSVKNCLGVYRHLINRNSLRSFSYSLRLDSRLQPFSCSLYQGIYSVQQCSPRHAYHNTKKPLFTSSKEEFKQEENASLSSRDVFLSRILLFSLTLFFVGVTQRCMHLLYEGVEQGDGHMPTLRLRTNICMQGYTCMYARPYRHSSHRLLHWQKASRFPSCV